eukprot:s1196_g17.t1
MGTEYLVYPLQLFGTEKDDPFSKLVPESACPRPLSSQLAAPGLTQYPTPGSTSMFSLERHHDVRPLMAPRRSDVNQQLWISACVADALPAMRVFLRSDRSGKMRSLS